MPARSRGVCEPSLSGGPLRRHLPHNLHHAVSSVRDRMACAYRGFRSVLDNAGDGGRCHATTTGRNPRRDRKGNRGDPCEVRRPASSDVPRGGDVPGAGAAGEGIICIVLLIGFASVQNLTTPVHEVDRDRSRLGGVPKEFKKRTESTGARYDGPKPGLFPAAVIQLVSERIAREAP